MKNKGLVIFFAIVFVITCIYQLSFTWMARKFETKAKAFATRNGVYDAERYRNYVDSMGRKPLLDIFIAKKDYFQCKDAELKLGLDLQGGMNVVLEVNKGEVIKTLAGSHAKDKDIIRAVEMAQADYQKSGGDFVDVFVKKFKEIAPGRQLQGLFVNTDNRRITMNSSESEVVNYLKTEMADKAQNTRQVIEARLNAGNISQPTIQELEGGRISVELPGVDNPTRIRTLLEQSARLEFWEVYSNNPATGFQAYKKIYEAINTAYSQKVRLSKGLLPTDSARLKTVLAIADSLQRDSAKKAFDAEMAKKDSSKVYPFAEAGLIPQQDQSNNIVEGPVLAIAAKESMNKINKMLADPVVMAAIPKDVKFAWSAKPRSEEAPVYELYALKYTKDDQAAMGSGEENIIADAYATNNPNTGRVEVAMSMTQTATRDWKNTTRKAAINNDYIAIVLDNKVFSAPRVNEEIPSGNSSISGSFSVEEATDLANVLKAGKLPAPANIVAEDVVGPTLGAESIRMGMNSLLIGFFLVLVLMLVYYSGGGMIATIAVFANLFFLIGILASWGAALTLPGIAGIVLTIGMAVDANVLIYERIKEEIRRGMALKTAVNNGFKAAMSSILDGNVTTLIAAIIMTFVGAGPVYGFAITLIIGIVTSLFTSVFVTRLLIDRRISKGKNLKFSNSFSENILINANFDFIGKRKKAYLFSTALIVIGFAVLISRGGLSAGIDFKGGYGYEMQLTQGTPSEAIKAELDKGLPESSNEVKTLGTNGRYKIVTSYKINDPNVSADKIEEDVLKALSKFNVSKTNILSSSEVGPTVAQDIRTKSMWVIIFSIIAIFLYIIIRFKNIGFSVGAIIALIHDVLMVFAIFALLDGIVPFSLEIDQNLIGAVLTIIGFSINDTVVIFDRIRENFTELRSEHDKAKLINIALNQTLSRTIMTSVTVFVVVLVLLLFGGIALKGFSLAMLIGVVMGSYSTIFIAAPIVLDLFKKDSSLIK